MEITGIVDGGVFCPDMGDVEITGVSGNITIKYSIKKTYATTITTFNEVYYPDQKGCVKIHGLGDIAMDYFGDIGILLRHNTHQYDSNPYLIIIYALIFNNSGGVENSFSQTFFYSKCRMSISLNDICFMSRFSTRMVREDQVVCLTSHGKFQDMVLGIAYKTDSEVRFHRIELPTRGGLGDFYTYFYSVPAVVERLNEALKSSYTTNDIVYYEVYYYDNDKIIDKVHFDIDRKHYPQITHFIFYNCFGFPETLYFTGKDERSAELEASFGSFAGNYLKTYTDLITSHTVNTGYINEAIRDSVEDMVHSSKVYLYEYDKLGDLITITGVDFTESKPRTEPLNVKLTYRVADECQRKFARAKIGDRIFDSTFDSTFD